MKNHDKYTVFVNAWPVLKGVPFDRAVIKAKSLQGQVLGIAIVQDRDEDVIAG